MEIGGRDTTSRRRPRVSRRTPRAVVTGGAGFIGSHLCDALLREGWEVFAVDDLSTGSLENVAHLTGRPGFHLIVQSVCDESSMRSLVRSCDGVWHLAAAVGVRLVVSRPVDTLTTNLRGTEVILEHCGRFDKPVLITSTSEVYGDHRSLRPLREDARRIYGPTTVSRWGYAASKAIDEFLALAFHRERGLKVVVARLFNTVGPRQTGRYGMVVPRFVDRALAGRPLPIFGTGLQTRCFCHVGDTVEALVGLLRNLPRTNGGIYNVGSASPISIVDLAERIIAMTGSTSAVEFVPYEEAFGEGFEDMLHRVPDIGRIGAAIGWQPRRRLDETLVEVIADRRRARAALGAA